MKFIEVAVWEIHSNNLVKVVMCIIGALMVIARYKNII